MIIHNVRQGSPEWMELRRGVPTASCFEKIITPTGKSSAQAEKYMYDLLAEFVLGPLEGPSMPWMQRGNDLESDAALWYGFQRDVEPEVVGFCTTDNGLIGASPDRLVGEEGLLELKCPSPGVHLQYLLHPSRGVDRAYFPQVQGQLLVTGRKWTDVVSYHPELPSVIVRVQRDEEYIALLSAGLDTFCKELANGRAELERRGLIRQPDPEPSEFLSESDANLIVADLHKRGAYGHQHVQQ